MSPDLLFYDAQHGTRRVYLVLSIALVVLALVTRRGCSRTVQYDVAGQVRALDTGKPLTGVTVNLERDFEAARANLKKGKSATTKPALPITSDLQGGFRFSVFSESRTLAKQAPRWWVVLSKQGYGTKTVDVSPDPNGPPSQKTDIRIVVYLRPITD